MERKKIPAAEQALAGTRAASVLKKAMENLINAPAYTNPAAAYTANEAALEAAEEIPVTREQWEKLYEVVRNIRLLAPWESLHESERVTLLLPGRDEPVYIVVMGSGGMTYGLSICPGYDSLNRLRRMEESYFDGNNLSVAFSQNCINLYFGDREELESRDKVVIKKLGLKFRGSNEWPYFRSMKPGFMPWYINRDEAELTIDALQNFAMACVAYQKKAFKVDFDKGETLLRFYDAEADIWYNTNVTMPPAPVIRPRLIIDDDNLIAGLKSRKKTRKKIGFSISYLPAPFQKSEMERPRMPRAAVLMDMNNGRLINQASDIDVDTISFGGAIIDMFSGYIIEHGRPISIAVNGDDRSYIADFAEKLGINLVEDEKLAMIGSLMMDIMDMINSVE